MTEGRTGRPLTAAADVPAPLRTGGLAPHGPAAHLRWTGPTALTLPMTFSACVRVRVCVNLCLSLADGALADGLDVAHALSACSPANSPALMPRDEHMS
jgi:hypothetical protein